MINRQSIAPIICKPRTCRRTLLRNRLRSGRSNLHSPRKKACAAINCSSCATQ